MTVQKLNDFLGDWQMTRQIEDRLTGAMSDLTGQARFTVEGDRLRYDETGELKIPGQQPLTASRAYIWQSSEQGIDVFFENGDPFHHFVPDGAQAAASHFCAPDQYDVRYDFSRWPNWSSIWDVTGPRKDYRMVTRYHR